MHSTICLDDLKQAALYFDRALWVPLPELQRTKTGFIVPEPVPEDALISLTFGLDGQTFSAKRDLRMRWVTQMERFAWDIRPAVIHAGGGRGRICYEHIAAAYLQDLECQPGRSIRKAFKEYASSVGIQHASVLLPTLTATTSEESENPVVTLASLELVDTSLADWQQILELRRDPTSHQKLQRLRSFVFEEFAGKPRSYIEDKLAAALLDYEVARRKHGFETVTSSITALLDAKNLQGAAAAAFVAGLLGGPVIGATAAAAIEIGKICVEYGRRRRVLKDWEKHHDLAFLIDAKRSLESEP